MAAQPQTPPLLRIGAMKEHQISNLTSLSPVEELQARAAISAPGLDRLRLGLPAVVGAPDGPGAMVIEPGSPQDPTVSDKRDSD